MVGLDAGTYGPHVSDGYYLMLHPLTVGEHHVRVHVASSYGGGFEYEINYYFNVVPRASR